MKIDPRVVRVVRSLGMVDLLDMGANERSLRAWLRWRVPGLAAQMKLRSM